LISLSKKSIKNVVLSVADNFWVDASDVGQQPGQFVWADGTKVDEALWQSGEPNNFGAGREACVYLFTESGKLRDFFCSYTEISFICEVADKDLPC